MRNSQIQNKNNATNFTWIPFYKEFANKLLEYQNNRVVLINKIKDIFSEMSNLELPTLERDNNIIDIDPFTVLGLFNKGISGNNRLELLLLIKKHFGLISEIPEDFDGVPVLNNQKSTFYHFLGDRQDNDIDNLWNLFMIALDYETNSSPQIAINFNNVFNKVKEQQGIRWNITMGLFWIAPDKYINLDSKNRSALKNAPFISDKLKQNLKTFGNYLPNGSNYLDFCQQLHNELAMNKKGINDFPEFSFYADRIANNNELSNLKENIAINIPLNQILYGPPGTGKTYNTSSIVKNILSSNKVSISKRSLKEITKETPWWQAIALSMYQNDKDKKYKVSELELLLKDYIPLKNNNTVKNKIWEQLQKHTDFSSETVFAKDRNEPYVFDKSKDSEWFLTEKGINYVEDQLINEEQISVTDEITDKYLGFITFHQSYSYEEFVEGIKPSMKDGQIKYSIENGIFKKMCIKANADPENNYVIVIDEINRGNISKIFGELITLIEEDKRIKSNGANDIDDLDLNLDDTSKTENSIIVKLPYSQKDFGVPNNLYILGTMNTSDRSIASIDIALRRRFKFVEMMPEPEKLVDENNQPCIVEGISLQELLQTLNERISYLLDRDHQIGHSYFMKWKNYDLLTLKDVWFDEIMPLLNEYFYSDWDKLQAILGKAEEKDKKAKESFIIKIKKPDLPYDIDCNDEDAYYDFSRKQDVNNEDFKKMLEHAKLIKTKSNESTETD